MRACEEGTAIEGRVQSVAVEDRFRFRPVFSDLVHGFGHVDGFRACGLMTGADGLLIFHGFVMRLWLVVCMKVGAIVD